jgi:hypothetical protein
MTLSLLLPALIRLMSYLAVARIFPHSWSYRISTAATALPLTVLRKVVYPSVVQVISTTIISMI